MSRHEELHTHVILSSVKMQPFHIWVYIRLRLLLQPIEAYKWKIMTLNMVFSSFSCVYRCSLPLPPTPPQPPSEWGASRELPTERMCVFQKLLSLRLPFFLFPFFQSWCQISARRWFDAIFPKYLGCCFVPGYKQRAPNSRQGATPNGFF